MNHMASTHSNDSDRCYLGLWRSPTTERMRPHLWPSPNLQMLCFRERHIEWSIRAVASSGKAERIHKLASWVTDIQEILPRGGKKQTFNVDKWPLHVTCISNTDSKSGVNRDSNQKINASVLPVLTAKVSAYNGKDFPLGLKSQFMAYIYIYLEPKWPLFLKVKPPKIKSFSNQNKGPHLGSRYLYISNISLYYIRTPWKINMEPTNHPFRKENDLPNLHFYVPC